MNNGSKAAISGVQVNGLLTRVGDKQVTGYTAKGVRLEVLG